jgi:hypothetical protein
MLCHVLWYTLVGTGVLEKLKASTLRVLKMELADLSETVVPIYQTTQHHILEDYYLHTLYIPVFIFLLFFCVTSPICTMYILRK